MAKALLLLIVALLAGCSVGPDYLRPVTPAPAQWNVEYQAAAELADLRWWQRFGDPVLESLVESALRNNLDLKEATAKVDQYLGALNSSRSQFFPQFSASITPGVQHTGGMTSESYQAALNASWELDLWGRIRRSSESAQAQIMATEAGRRGTILTLVTSVASAYLTLRGLDRLLEISRDSEKAYAESLKLFQLRFKHGTISQLELSQQENLYETARQEIPNNESLIRQQENALSLLLGRAPGPIPRGKELDALKPPGIPAGLPSQLLERRPDIIQAEQDLIAANADIGAAKAEYFPKLSLTGALGVASSDMGKLFTPAGELWSLGGELAGPVFNFGATAGKVRQAESKKEQALFRYQKAILTGFRDVEDALIKTTKGKEQLESQTRQLHSLEEYARLSKLQFEAGTSDYLQVLDADRSLFNSKLALIKSKYELLSTVVSVYKAMGGGWISEADKLGGTMKLLEQK